MNPGEATNQYDAAFQSVTGLAWLPWVGQHYSDRPSHKRLLVVGESHYFKGNTPEERQKDREEYLKHNHWTREQVLDSHINGDWSTPTLRKIPDLLFNTSEIDGAKLWADSAYYNFVQRPMDYHVKERPSADDFVTGWRVFEQVARIIRPSYCVFIGVSAADFCNLGNVSKHEKVGGVWPRVATLVLDGKGTELCFVHHLSRCKNVAIWHDYLQTQLPEFMRWLLTENYIKVPAASC